MKTLDVDMYKKRNVTKLIKKTNEFLFDEKYLLESIDWNKIVFSEEKIKRRTRWDVFILAYYQT